MTKVHNNFVTNIKLLAWFWRKIVKHRMKVNDWVLTSLGNNTVLNLYSTAQKKDKEHNSIFIWRQTCRTKGKASHGGTDRGQLGTVVQRQTGRQRGWRPLRVYVSQEWWTRCWKLPTLRWWHGHQEGRKARLRQQDSPHWPCGQTICRNVLCGHAGHQLLEGRQGDEDPAQNVQVYVLCDGGPEDPGEESHLCLHGSRIS